MRLRVFSLCMIVALTLTGEALAIVPRGEGSEIPKHPLMKALGETPEFQARIEALKGRYSINLLASPNAFDGHVFQEKARHWSEKNPQARVHVWYDSRDVSGPLVEEEPESPGVDWRDVRDIPAVAQNPDVFSGGLPILFREELLRVILLHHLVSSGEDALSIYTEPGIDPLTRSEIFDTETENHLKTTGLVMNAGSHFPMATDFQILSGHHPHLLEAMEFVLIRLNLERAHLARRQGYFLMPGGRKMDFFPLHPLKDTVFLSYSSMLQLFYAEDQKLDLEFFLDGAWEVYAQSHNGFLPFGLERCMDPIFTLRFSDKGGFFSIPTKTIPGDTFERQTHDRPYYSDDPF